MKLLLMTAVRNYRHLLLMCVTLVSMLGLTIASQMEMFAVGVITNSNEVLNGAKSDHNVLQNIMVWVRDKAPWSTNLAAMAIVLVFVAILKAITQFTSRYYTQLVAIRVSQSLRQQFFEHIQKLPMSFYAKHNIGGLATRVVGDAGQVAHAINGILINYLESPFTIISTLGWCFYLSWKLSLLVFIGLPLIVFPIAFLTGRLKRVSRQMQGNQEAFASVIVDFLTGIQTVKIYVMEVFSLRKYCEQNDRMAVLEEKSARYFMLTRPILHIIASLFLCVVILYGMHVVKMDLSEVIVFAGFLYLFYEPIKKFADENMQIQRGVVAAERMYEVLSLKPDIDDFPHAVELETIQEGIEFDHVWFKYNDDWVLKDLSFTVKKGEFVAIVGPTGCGKSTIVQLLPRLYEVDRGEIRVDGKPVQAYTQRSLRENMSLVPQRPCLFLDTVAANLSFGRDFSIDEIQNAAERAHAHEFIRALPEGYQSMLSEAGKNLSGGQQQRLAIARALLKRASLLIMDEATSALDGLSEQRIKEALKSIRGKVTQIVIAHRLSTIEDADRIIYMEEGRKVAEGTRDELYASCPPFKALWDVMMNHNTLLV